MQKGWYLPVQLTINVMFCVKHSKLYACWRWLSWWCRISFVVFWCCLLQRNRILAFWAFCVNVFWLTKIIIANVTANLKLLLFLVITRYILIELKMVIGQLYKMYAFIVSVCKHNVCNFLKVQNLVFVTV